MAADHPAEAGWYVPFRWRVSRNWFGLFLADGRKTEAVDTLTELWSGHPPADRCPRIESIRQEGSAEVEPGATVRATLSALNRRLESLLS